MSDALTPSEWRDIIERENEDGLDGSELVRLALAERPFAAAQVALYNHPDGFDDLRNIGDPNDSFVKALRRAVGWVPESERLMLAECARRIEALQVPG